MLRRQWQSPAPGCIASEQCVDVNEMPPDDSIREFESDKYLSGAYLNVKYLLPVLLQNEDNDLSGFISCLGEVVRLTDIRDTTVLLWCQLIRSEFIDICFDKKNVYLCMYFSKRH